MPIYMFKKINSLEEKKKQHQRDTVLYVCCFPSKKKKIFPYPLIKRHIYGKIWSVKNVIKG